jgi:hypothetical protein
MSRIFRLIAISAALSSMGASTSVLKGAELNEGDYPEKVIEAGGLRLRVAIPDSQKGFYRSTRYDWSGMITEAFFQGHRFFVPYRQPQNPLDPNHGAGSAEEFDQESPPGFATAAEGDAFLKIGVGVLRRSGTEPYRFFHRYEIADGGTWTTSELERGLRFVHRVGEGQEWGYEYEKTLTVNENGSEFVIERRLRNIGTRAIDTTHYSHHFVQFDQAPIDSAYEIEMPSEYQTEEERPVEIAGAALRTSGTVEKGFLVRFRNATAVANASTLLRHRLLGLHLSFSVNRPLDDFRVYYEPSIICPEPFVRLSAGAGTDVTWRTVYRLGITK